MFGMHHPAALLGMRPLLSQMNQERLMQRIVLLLSVTVSKLAVMDAATLSLRANSLQFIVTTTLAL